MLPTARRPRRQRRSARHRHAPACSEPVPRSCSLSLHASRLLQRTAEAPERRVPKGPVLLPLGPQPRASPLSCCPRRARCRGPSPRHELWVCSPARKHTRGHGCYDSELVFSSGTRLSCRGHGSEPRASSRRPASRPRRGATCVIACSLLSPACGSPMPDKGTVWFQSRSHIKDFDH